MNVGRGSKQLSKQVVGLMRQSCFPLALPLPLPRGGRIHGERVGVYDEGGWLYIVYMKGPLSINEIINFQ